MVVRRRRKSRKLRGRTRTMSWGRIGQHRKAGSRGGRGAAGLGKHEWTWTIKYAPNWFGKKGFKPPRIRIGYRPVTINVVELQELIDEMKIKKTLSLEGDKIVVNLESMGIHKLLGEGRIKDPVKVIVPNASREAVEKIREAGGEVILTRGEAEEAVEA
ncbi:MAG: 50S ribosomal protein L15 [Desulfurococcales archaeon]|nr:50S ribosomal protein L15 [Desulfurococcales archaeon]